MNNKLLLSMLTAAVVPAGALASVDVTPLVQKTDWTMTGIDGQTETISGDNLITKGVTTTSASAQLKVTLAELPVGSYTLKLAEGSGSNLAIEGATYDEKTGNWTFVVEKAGDYTLTLKSADEMHGFGVKIDNLSVNLDKFTADDTFDTILDMLTNQANEDYQFANSCVIGDDSQTAKDLNKEADDYNQQLGDLAAVVAKLKAATEDADVNAYQAKADDAAETLDEATQAETNAQTAAGDAAQAVTTAQTAADDAAQAVTTAQTDVDSKTIVYNEADAKVATTGTTYDDASSVYREAVSKYDSITILTNPFNYRRAKQDAKDAMDAAESVMNDAAKAYSDAKDERSEAETALNDAKTVLATANSEKGAADAALATAKSEKEAADAALQTATEEKAQAERAKTAADEALKTAKTNKDANDKKVLDYWKEYNQQAGTALVEKNEEGKTLVDIHNENVEAENARYQQEKDNAADFTSCTSILADAQKELDKINTLAEDIAGKKAYTSSIMQEEKKAVYLYPLATIADEAAAVQAAIDAAMAQAEALYTDKNKDQKASKEDVEALEKAINAIAVYPNKPLSLKKAPAASDLTAATDGSVKTLADDLAKAIADAEAYTQVQKNLESLKKLYDQDTHFLQPITNGTAARYMDELQEIYDTAKAELAAREIEDANKNAADDQKFYDGVVAAMADVIARAKARLETNQKAYDELQKALADDEDATKDGTLVQSVDAIQAEIDKVKDPVNKQALQDKLDEINGKIADLRNQVDDEYKKYELVYDDGGTPADDTDDTWSHKDDVEDLAQALADLSTTTDKAQKYDENTGVLAGYMDDLDAARKAIVDAVTDGNEKINGEKVAVAFDAAYNSIKTAITKYQERLTGSLKEDMSSQALDPAEEASLKADIKAYAEKGLETAQKVQGELANWKALDADANKLYDLVDEWGKLDGDKYVYAVSYAAPATDQPKWKIEASDYKTLVAAYLTAIEGLVDGEYATNRGEDFYKSVKAFGKADTKGTINKVTGAEEMAISALSAKYFFDKRYDFAVMGVTPDNYMAVQALYDAKNATYNTTESKKKYGVEGDKALQDMKAYWNGDMVIHAWTENETNVVGINPGHTHNTNEKKDHCLMQETKIYTTKADDKKAESDITNMAALQPDVVKAYYAMIAEAAENEAKAETSKKNFDALETAVSDAATAISDAIANAKATINGSEFASDNEFYLKQIEAIETANAAADDELTKVQEEYTAEYKAIGKKAKDSDKKGDWINNDGINDADYQAYLNRINDEKVADFQAINDILDAAAANEASHKKLLDKEEETVKYINDNIDYIKTNYDPTVVVTYGDKEMTVQEVLDAIEALKSTNTDELPGVSVVNNEVRESFDKGENEKDEAALTQKYQDIEDAVKALVAAVDGDYLTSVKEKNNEQIAAIWGPELIDLYEAFRHGVSTYEVYKNANENEDYHNALMEKLGDDHAQAIYDYAPLIAQLRKDVAAFEQSLLVDADGNKLGHEEGDKFVDEPILFDENDPEFVRIMGLAAQYIDEMNAYAEDIETIAQATAEAYYATKLAEANKVIGDAVADMDAAGIPTEIQAKVLNVKGAQDDRDLADFLKKLYSNENTPAAGEPGQAIVLDVNKPVLSLYMDKIIELLEGVSVDTEKAADLYWAAQTAAAGVELAEIEKVFKDKDGNVIEYLEDLKNQFDQLKSDYVELAAKDATINDSDENYVKNLVYELDQILAAARNLKDEAETEIKKHEDNEKLKGNLEQDLDDLKDAYEALKDAVGALDLTLDQFKEIDTPAIGEKIKQLEDALDDFSYDKKVSVNEQNFNDMISGIEAAITEAYDKAYKAQEKNLNDPNEGLVHDVQYAYDTAMQNELNEWKDRVKNETMDGGQPSDETMAMHTAIIDKYDAINAEIEEQKKNIADAIDALENSGKTDADYQKALKDLHNAEEALEDIMREILGITDDSQYEGENDGQASKDYIAELEGIYYGILGSYADAQTALENADEIDDDTKAGFEKDLQDLKDELDDVKKAWEKDNQRVLNHGEYEEKMQDIKDKLDQLTTDINDAQDAALKARLLAEANQSRLEALEAQVDDLQDLLDSVTVLAGANNIATIENYQDRIDEIQGWIDDAADDLEDNKDNLVKYNANGEIVNCYDLPNVQKIEDAVAALKDKIVNDEIVAQKKAAKEALDKAQDAVSKLEDQGYVFADNEDGNVAKILDWMETSYDGIKNLGKDDFGSIQGTAEEIVETANKLIDSLEDRKVKRGDVSLNGKLSVLDYNMLLRLILENEKVEYVSTDKELVAADVNGNERVDMADVTSVINLLTGRTVDSKKAAPARPVEGENSLSMAFVENNGARRLAISLSNAASFVNAQMDIMLPEGISVVGCSTADRAGHLDLHTNDFGNGRYRIILASPEINTIEGNEGALIYLDIEGSASSDIAIVNAEASDANAVCYSLNVENAKATGVNTVTDAVIAKVKQVYTVGGQMIDSMKKGINILVGNDGKATKVLKK